MSRYNRRDFLKRLALFGGAVAAGQFVIPANAVLESRPLEVLAIGDSVIWGQGLEHGNKFTTRVCDWLKAETGRKLNFHNESHSGATILPEIDNGAVFHGEINVSSPSIFQQVRNSAGFYKTRNVADGGKLPPEAVDLIILDGGINDMNPTKIIFSKSKKIKDQSEKYCYKQMKKLLAATAAAFPNARIAAIGYFPLVTPFSNRNEVIETALAVFGENGAEDFVARQIKKLLNKIPADKQVIFNALVERSTTWKDENNNHLKKAIDELNAAEKSNGFSTDNPRILFVKTPFEDKNGYAVEDTTWLWRIKEGLKTDDQMFEARREICRAVQNIPFKEITCRRAGAFHPNIAGAQKYAGAITDQLKQVMDKTGWKA